MQQVELGCGQVGRLRGALPGLMSWMFSQSTVLAVLRDLAFRVLSVRSAIAPITRLLADPPDPGHLTAAASVARDG